MCVDVGVGAGVCKCVGLCLGVCRCIGCGCTRPCSGVGVGACVLLRASVQFIEVWDGLRSARYP